MVRENHALILSRPVEDLDVGSIETANIAPALRLMPPCRNTSTHCGEEIHVDDTEANAHRTLKHLCESYGDKYPTAVETLEKDRDELMAFYRFPAAHWKHIRSTNVIESVFATVRLRTCKTKGLGTYTATLSMTFKLLQEAQKSWRRIVRWQQLELIQAGREFKDGVLVEESAA